MSDFSTLVTHRMTQPITTIGDPVLRQVTRTLTRPEILSTEIQKLIERMRETMHAAPGVGLAAPQIGLPLSLAVIEDKAEYSAALTRAQVAERERLPVPFQVIINPVVTLESNANVEFFEGCLSLAGLVALVPRARQVRVECLDHRGEPQVLRANGWYARILQHESDHLAGTLYVDRMHSRSLCTTDHYTSSWRDLSIAEVKRRLRIA